MRFSRYANGVAMQHGKVSRDMFPEFNIDSITNGVHAPTWISEPVQQMLDSADSRLAARQSLPAQCHRSCPSRRFRPRIVAPRKRCSLRWLHAPAWCSIPSVLTLGFARRAATYKRANLLFTDPERLLKIAADAGGLQILYAGKAHPQDEPGKALIHDVIEMAGKLSSDVLRIVYLENYDWDLGALLTAGVDVWVNTPRRPYEASGTSGMKAALNGVPSLSILDGWWIEGCIEGVTGWAIEDGANDEEEASIALPQARKLGGSALSASAGKVGAPDAHHTGLQRLLLQHQPHGQAVHAQRLLPGQAA